MSLFSSLLRFQRFDTDHHAYLSTSILPIVSLLRFPANSSVAASALPLPANLFSGPLSTSPYPTFHFKVNSFDGPSAAVADSFIVYFGNLRNRATKCCSKVTYHAEAPIQQR